LTRKLNAGTRLLVLVRGSKHPAATCSTFTTTGTVHTSITATYAVQAPYKALARNKAIASHVTAASGIEPSAEGLVQDERPDS
jgi:hypothetical protein